MNNRLKLETPKIAKGRDREWVSIYRCECGNTLKASDTKVRNNRVRSCGCLQKERSAIVAKTSFTTHGKSKTKEYRTWGDMIARCEIQSSSSYAYYGGRGIKVCTRWRSSFENFLSDMGQKPVGKSLDRVDNDGNYEPGNCRWATKSEQMKNRRPFKR